MEYKSVEKYLNKHKKNKKESRKSKSFVYGFTIRLFICIVIVLLGLIFLKSNPLYSEKVNNFLNKHDINLASVNAFYRKHFGDILPFQNVVSSKSKSVFDEVITYKEASVYKDGVKLTTESNYLIPILKSGIVVFSGDKEGYGNTIIIEGVDGVDVWYGNITNVNVSLYDYVNEGEFLGEAEGSFYMVFEKDGKYLNYKNYLK